jgi:hypothetical protein
MLPLQQGVNDIQGGTKAAMALSGDTLPQVSDGGWVSGTLHIVTTDGAGPYKAMIDTTGTGNFANAKTMDIVTQVPGTKGNIKKTKTKRWERILRSVGIEKRATNVNEDYVSSAYKNSPPLMLR